MTTLLCLSIALAAGLIMSRFVKPLKLPAVTGYLVAGILVGPYLLGSINVPGLGFNSMEQIASLSIISEVALGFIAFSIGNEFRLSQLRKNGVQATVVGIFQAVVTTLVVDAALITFHFIAPDKLPLPVAITLGAIAAATAPAATLMVVRQYKAKGELTDILLPVVALDDAVGLIIFAVSFGIARAFQDGNVDMISILVNPLVEIVVSLALGALMGYVLTFAEKHFFSGSKRLSMAVTFVLLTVGLSMLDFHIGPVHVSFSTLLVCMMLGTVFCNICDFSEDLMEKTDKWTAPLFVLFFVMSGAELELSVFTDLMIVAIGVAYIASRSVGKCLGARVSAQMSHCSPSIVKYLGITLLPQAGVALGMSITALQLGPENGTLIRNIVLFAVLVYELVGPALTRMALQAAGDISPRPPVQKQPNKNK